MGQKAQSGGKSRSISKKTKQAQCLWHARCMGEWMGNGAMVTDVTWNGTFWKRTHPSGILKSSTSTTAFDVLVSAVSSFSYSKVIHFWLSWDNMYFALPPSLCLCWIIGCWQSFTGFEALTFDGVPSYFVLSSSLCPCWDLECWLCIYWIRTANRWRCIDDISFPKSTLSSLPAKTNLP